MPSLQKFYGITHYTFKLKWPLPKPFRCKTHVIPWHLIGRIKCDNRYLVNMVTNREGCYGNWSKQSHKRTNWQTHRWKYIDFNRVLIYVKYHSSMLNNDSYSAKLVYLQLCTNNPLGRWLFLTMYDVSVVCLICTQFYITVQYRVSANLMCCL